MVSAQCLDKVWQWSGGSGRGLWSYVWRLASVVAFVSMFVLVQNCPWHEGLEYGGEGDGVTETEYESWSGKSLNAACLTSRYRRAGDCVCCGKCWFPVVLGGLVLLLPLRVPGVEAWTVDKDVFLNGLCMGKERVEGEMGGLTMPCRLGGHFFSVAEKCGHELASRPRKSRESAYHTFSGAWGGAKTNFGIVEKELPKSTVMFVAAALSGNVSPLGWLAFGRCVRVSGGSGGE